MCVSQHVSEAGGGGRATLTESLRRVQSMSQVPPLHSSAHMNTHFHTCTPAVSLPHLGHQCTQTHMHSNVHAPIHCTETQSNFYSAIIKFMQSSTGHFSPVVPVVLRISLDMVLPYTLFTLSTSPLHFLRCLTSWS